MHGRSRLAIELFGAELIIDDVGVVDLRQRTLRVDAARPEAEDIGLERRLQRHAIGVGGKDGGKPGAASVEIARDAERPAFVGPRGRDKKESQGGDDKVAATYRLTVASALSVRQTFCRQTMRL